METVIVPIMRGIITASGVLLHCEQRDSGGGCWRGEEYPCVRVYDDDDDRVRLTLFRRGRARGVGYSI